MIRFLPRKIDAAEKAALPFIAVAEYRYGLQGSTKSRDAQKLFEGLLQILPILFPT